MAERGQTIPVFPLAGALLFPRSQLPLHIFEPRYRDMITDAMAGERLIGMVQPRDARDPPGLFAIGCLGHIAECDKLKDGRYNIVLRGLGRFRILRELPVTTLYRQVEADRGDYAEPDDEVLGLAARAEIERESRAYADSLGYMVDWDAVSRLDDEQLVNGICQIAPLDVGSKQALLEARTLDERADLLVQFMQFQRMAPGGADGPQTLQ
ncbi:LON peptidase substrate-binding domain-containing protein [Sphingosinicella ginsenosidimutans]|uniref:ATP-dependent protease n=1 Tax=Allosphingosinicella ginsenosidimutans TaxID=1176539 RepID=A0A5C6TTC7_9SPHN|nr:LON peptidase substrate-binding domain-containing protein [Sphingosinicella ginsenosidimutans]TXC63261.1 ATP-dependent protease [Sphingosinicella ginsenosidimutans]